MKSFKKYLLYLVIALGTCVIILSLLSLMHDLKFWYVKALDFPRLQYLILATISLIFFLVLNKKWKFPSIILVLGLVISVVIHGRLILPYYLGEKTVLDASDKQNEKFNTVGILIANVLINNKNSEGFLRIIQNSNPDLILALEVDQWWIDKLQMLKKDYPYFMELPLDNAYGMALYSKLPLKNKEKAFLNQKDVPSFHTEVLSSSGKSFLFHGVHPVPPFPSEKYPDNVGEKELALIKVGKIVKKEELPSIVAGDFNDVSWSHTSRLFQNSGNLNNVRIGRGVYSTFNANSLIMRWPLDHFFVTKEFSVLKFKRLGKFGSDHFPIFAEFILAD